MARYSRQGYINKEYDRLITQAKKQFAEMNLGKVFGPSLPSFEKILNFAGTKSGLKRPTRSSLKALRKLQGEEGILWGIEHTLNKKDTFNLKKVQAQREELEKQQKAIKKAEKKVKEKYKEQYQTLSREDKKALLAEILDPINTLLSELRYWKNYSNEELNNASRKGPVRKNRLNTAYETADEHIKKIESILSSADSVDIGNLSINAAHFYATHPEGVSIQDLYDGGKEVSGAVQIALHGVTEDMSKPEMQPPEITPPAITNEELPIPLEDVFDNKMFEAFSEGDPSDRLFED